MNRYGFTLIELIVVIAIMGILLSVATLSFQEYSQKANIESQVRSLYSDIIQMRSSAMFSRTAKSATYTATTFKIFSSNVVTVTPIIQRTLRYPISWTNSGQINFDGQGLILGVSSASICVTDNNNASIDSIVIGAVRTQMGKRDGTCSDAHIEPK